MGMRVGIGHDTHRLGANRPLILGGVEIPHPVGLLGHSDADALFHAITDALLGAVGKGDIGEWFPDTAPENKDQDSRFFLAEVLREALPQGTKIINLDCIIFAERPKLSPYKEAIRNQVARILDVPPIRINVKAKTGEKVGPIGREEAISTMVVVLLDIPEESVE
jgi:2-C-methyl-D-erythritol 2,4-cyclodiphosphate synthase